MLICIDIMIWALTDVLLSNKKKESEELLEGHEAGSKATQNALKYILRHAEINIQSAVRYNDSEY